MNNDKSQKDNVVTFQKGNDSLGKDTYVNGRSTADVFNRKKGKYGTQNFIMMDDIIVPIITKKDNDGNEYFAMQYTYNPISNKILLELPKIGIEIEKAQNIERQRTIKFDSDNEKYETEVRVTYNESDIHEKLNDLSKNLLLSPIEGTQKNLSTYFDAVSASFTNQMAKYVELEVKNENGDKRINWFPISSLKDVLSRGLPMSAPTYYGLSLYAFTHRDKLKEMNQTTAEINEALLDDAKEYFFKKYVATDGQEISEIYPEEIHDGKNSYKQKQHVLEQLFLNKRFDVEEVEIPGYIQELMAHGEIDYASGVYSEQSDVNNKYTTESFIGATSKDSIQCVIFKKGADNTIKVAVQKNMRSPFFDRLGKDYACFYEIVAGGIEPKDSENTTSEDQVYRNAVIREVREEAGFEAKRVNKLIKGSKNYSLGTDEETFGFVVEVTDDEKPKEQQLDDDEHIGNIRWITLPKSPSKFIEMLNELNCPGLKKGLILELYNNIINELEKQNLNKGKIQNSLVNSGEEPEI